MVNNIFLEYLNERGLVRTEQLGALQNCRLGVQGDHFLRQVSVTDPFHIALGGVPHNLYAVVYSQVDQLKCASASCLVLLEAWLR